MSARRRREIVTFYITLLGSSSPRASRFNKLRTSFVFLSTSVQHTTLRFLGETQCAQTAATAASRQGPLTLPPPYQVSCDHRHESCQTLRLVLQRSWPVKIARRTARIRVLLLTEMCLCASVGGLLAGPGPQVLPFCGGFPLFSVLLSQRSSVAPSVLKPCFGVLWWTSVSGR